MQEMICIVCPMGCHLLVEQQGEEVCVQGNLCPRGARYAAAEMTDPRRTLTTSVFVQGGEMALVSVRSREPLPKGKLGEVLTALHALQISAPVALGDVVLANACGTGTDIIATRNVAKR